MRMEGLNGGRVSGGFGDLGEIGLNEDVGIGDS